MSPVNPAAQELRNFRSQWESALVHKFTDMLLEIDNANCGDKQRLQQELQQYLIECRKSTGQLFGIGIMLRVDKWFEEAVTLVPVQKAMYERYNIKPQTKVLFGKAGIGLGREIKHDILVETMSDLVQQARRALREIAVTQN